MKGKQLQRLMRTSEIVISVVVEYLLTFAIPVVASFMEKYSWISGRVP